MEFQSEVNSVKTHLFLMLAALGTVVGITPTDSLQYLSAIAAHIFNSGPYLIVSRFY